MSCTCPHLSFQRFLVSYFTCLFFSKIFDLFRALLFLVSTRLLPNWSQLAFGWISLVLQFFKPILFTESETVYRPGSNCKRASFWLHIYQHSLLISWSLWTARASKSTPSRTSEETLCIKGPVPIVALFFALLLLLISQEARSSIVCFLVWARRAWPLNKWTSPAQKSSFSCFLRVPSIFCYVWKTWRVLIILSILWVSL